MSVFFLFFFCLFFFCPGENVTIDLTLGSAKDLTRIGLRLELNLTEIKAGQRYGVIRSQGYLAIQLGNRQEGSAGRH